jgi:hypothetical protein
MRLRVRGVQARAAPNGPQLLRGDRTVMLMAQIGSSPASAFSCGRFFERQSPREANTLHPAMMLTLIGGV